MSIILGIETSCDETGIALYDSNPNHPNGGLLAETLYSQINLHTLYGGVVPELASRDHITRIIPLIDECLHIANITKQDIDAIAYTAGPGLNGALLVGAATANGLGFSLNKPVIPIHHLEGHLLSPLLSNPELKPPFIALLVSGGHSQLIAVKAIGNYEILGDTLDDAAGEAFDKTAKMMGLGYPGGSVIAKLAQAGQKNYTLPRPMLHSGDLNMSFSGLKTAVSILISKLGGLNQLTQIMQQDLAYAIEDAITDVLSAKAKLALEQTKINCLVVSGGVSANLTLRKKLNQLQESMDITTHYPPLNLCTDNGAMIALAGSIRYNERCYNYAFNVKPRWELSKIDER